MAPEEQMPSCTPWKPHALTALAAFRSMWCHSHAAVPSTLERGSLRDPASAAFTKRSTSDGFAPRSSRDGSS